MFAKRFDFIIRLSKIQVNTLAKAAMIDPSYVSKLRTGARKLPKNPVFLDDMLDYIVIHIKDEEQKAIIAEIIGDKWPDDKMEVKSFLKNWLLADDYDLGLLGGLVDTMLLARGGQSVSELGGNSLAKVKKHYYGVEGKKECALALFDLVLSQEKPRTIYLNSSENMSWMAGDENFIKLWEKKLIDVILAGNKIIIIHSTKRNINEMIYGAAKWSSIYMNGTVESYYYPGIRDSLIQRTLFIADDLVALSSVSIENDTEGMLNAVFTDKKAVRALRKEFKNFLAVCKPLSLIINKSNLTSLKDIITSVSKNSYNLKSVSLIPHIFTMPESVAKSMQKRSPESNIYKAWTFANEYFKKIMQTSTYTEVLQDKDSLLKNPEFKSELAFGGFLAATDLTYTEDELSEHYKNVDALAKKYPNYKPVYIKTPLKNQFLCSLDSEGFVLARPSGENVMTVFMQDIIMNTYKEYLDKYIEDLRIS